MSDADRSVGLDLASEVLDIPTPKPPAPPPHIPWQIRELGQLLQIYAFHREPWLLWGPEGPRLSAQRCSGPSCPAVTNGQEKHPQPGKDPGPPGEALGHTTRPTAKASRGRPECREHPGRETEEEGDGCHLGSKANRGHRALACPTHLLFGARSAREARGDPFPSRTWESGPGWPAADPHELPGTAGTPASGHGLSHRKPGSQSSPGQTRQGELHKAQALGALLAAGAWLAGRAVRGLCRSTASFATQVAPSPSFQSWGPVVNIGHPNFCLCDGSYNGEK